MPSPIITERAFDFSIRILRLAERLWERGPIARHIATQVMRCGTSVGANAEEAEEAQTKADFIAKLSVSRKECRETGYWLRLAVTHPVVKPHEIDGELDEARQLLAMIRSAIKTARSSGRRSND
jgi:four helix bundle protein